MNQEFKARGRWACSAARVFDGERVLREHAVIVQEGRVVGVVPQIELPLEMPTFAAPDCTLLPGLIDTHVHFMRWQGPLFLTYGVTTIRDCGNDLAWILERRAEWRSNLWPRILSLGPLLDGPQPIHQLVARACHSADEAETAVSQLAEAGVDGIKLYVGLPADWLPAIVRASNFHGLKVSMHCGGSAPAAGRAGVDEFFHLDGILAHVWPTHPPGWLEMWGNPEFNRTWDAQQRAADAIRALGMTATPTLAYWESQWRVLRVEHQTSADLRHVPQAIIATQAAGPLDPVKCARWQRALRAAQQFVGLLAARGVLILAGTDVPCGAVPPGLGLWREMALLVEAGLSPLRALKAATSEAATFLGRTELGGLRPGSVADMVLVRGNPIERIPETPEITAVIRQGVVHRPQDLLLAANTALGGLAEEPWARQFALHAKVYGDKAVDL